MTCWDRPGGSGSLATGADRPGGPLVPVSASDPADRQAGASGPHPAAAARIVWCAGRASCSTATSCCSSRCTPRNRNRATGIDLVALRSELEHARATAVARLDREQARRLSERVLSDLEVRVESLPDPALAEDAAGSHEPRNTGRGGRRAADPDDSGTAPRSDGAGVRYSAIDRYLRLFDLPLVRRLPFVRKLVAYREKSPAEAVALAANYLGHSIQRGLDVVYFFADLHGTLSPPVFLDRLGATIVNATRTPAKRLLWLGSAFLFLFLIVNCAAVLHAVRQGRRQGADAPGLAGDHPGGDLSGLLAARRVVSQDRQSVG